jgi:hypothetical protein
MILDYPMLRDLAAYHRNQVINTYAAGSAHAQHKLPRRRWSTRPSHDAMCTAPTPTVSPTAREAH